MSYTQLRHAFHRARTQHKCIWCGGVINKGDLYDRVVGIYEGEFQDDCYHPDCKLACKDYFRNNPYEEDFEPYEQERPKY